MANAAGILIAEGEGGHASGNQLVAHSDQLFPGLGSAFDANLLEDVDVVEDGHVVLAQGQSVGLAVIVLAKLDHAGVDAAEEFVAFEALDVAVVDLALELGLGGVIGEDRGDVAGGDALHQHGAGVGDHMESDGQDHTQGDKQRAQNGAVDRIHFIHGGELLNFLSI